uniref:DDE-1 domain-containing protein n=1 Tax=Photinus pyralis TaxID=7054 RepID=A0A1Y1N7V7_PHOPY
MRQVYMYVPPMLVFPRKNMKSELLDGAPPGTIAKCHPSGWIQQDLFTAWFHHFIKHVKPCVDDQVVLILDGHYSHTRNIDIINIARENYIHIVCLPPHSTHKLQPLDVAFMSPFKTYYAQAIERWLKHNPGRLVTAYQIAELMGESYLRAASVEVAVNGFRKCGIFPVNRHVFRDDDFAIHAQRERTPPPSQEESDNENIAPNCPTPQTISTGTELFIHSYHKQRKTGFYCTNNRISI